MEIIITDLTRFTNPDIVCTAGINPATNECIRPLPYLPTNKCRRLNILPGAIIKGTFVARPFIDPHSEDRSVHGQLSFKGPCNSKEFKSILEATESPSFEKGFSIALDDGQKHIPIETPPKISIITLSIDSGELSIVPDTFKPGKIKAIFRDNSGKHFRYLAITDLGFYNYAEKYSQSNRVDELNDFIHSQEEVFIRLGLSREFRAPDGRYGYWLQVNGIYTFPDFFEDIRCHE